MYVKVNGSSCGTGLKTDTADSARRFERCATTDPPPGPTPRAVAESAPIGVTDTTVGVVLVQDTDRPPNVSPNAFKAPAVRVVAAPTERVTDVGRITRLATLQARYTFSSPARIAARD